MKFLIRYPSGDWMLGGWPLALLCNSGKFVLCWKARVIWESR